MKVRVYDLPKATDFLDIKVIQGSDFIARSQKKQIQLLVDIVGITECRNITVPFETSVDLSSADGSSTDSSFSYTRVMGILLYIATHTRSDIAVATSILAGHVESPSNKHQAAAVKVIKYLRSTNQH